jgi:hypothetical protein
MVRLSYISLHRSSRLDLGLFLDSILMVFLIAVFFCFLCYEPPHGAPLARYASMFQSYQQDLDLQPMSRLLHSLLNFIYSLVCHVSVCSPDGRLLLPLLSTRAIVISFPIPMQHQREIAWTSMCGICN